MVLGDGDGRRPYTGRVDQNTVARISEQKAHELSRHKLQSGNIVFPRRGDINKCTFINWDEEGYLCGTGCLKVEVPQTYLPKFFYYYLSLPQTAQWLESNAVGTTMLNLNTSILGRLYIPVIDFNEQKRIVDVLEAYDDMIENNRRRIQLLEESARLLYREWFVHLRFPGHEHTRIVDGVPEGWMRKTIGEVCATLEDGDWIESKDQGGDDYRLIQISNIGINEFVETGNFRFISSDTFRRLRCREILPGNILIARMPTPIGRAWMVTEMPWKMVTAVDVAILEPRTEIADAHFLLYHLNSQGNIALCISRAGGATRPRITRKNIAALPVVLPSHNIQAEFREVCEPVHLQRTTLFRQTQKLQQARDLLLPRLMSGEITV
jgi:type I restriction enzyme S subunit